MNQYSIEKVANAIVYFVNSKVEHFGKTKLMKLMYFADKYHLETAKYVDWGGSPRASIGIFISSKAEALMRNNIFVKPDYVKKVVPDVLRHRIILNYLAQAEDVTADDVISEILKKIAIP